MKFARWGACALAAALSLPAFAGGNAEVGEEKANTCMGCHGIPGYNNVYPTYRVPYLGGQQPKYIENALKAYRNRDRPHGTMHAQASNLTDQDIADIAAYISTAPAHR